MLNNETTHNSLIKLCGGVPKEPATIGAVGAAASGDLELKLHVSPVRFSSVASTGKS
jgi:hypothetical protein